MIINDKPAASVTNIYNAQRVKGAEKSRRDVSTIGRGVADGDQIEISEAAQVLTKANEAVANADEVRWDKVGPLRDLVASGKYQVPINDLAKKLLADV
jgi:flagellar biosynthesis anti-sigma factor FlgM